ncbi:hypothetical protein [Mesorhizobium japonicum]
MTVDPQAWLEEAEATGRFFGEFGDRVPPELRRQLEDLRRRTEALLA